MQAAAPKIEASFTENIAEVPLSEQMKLFNKTWMPAVEKGMPKWIDKDGNYQYDRYLEALKLVPARRVSIDVGANIGLFTRRMAADFKTVICFEPVPIARACLSRNVTANNCILYPYGLGSGEYETQISYCDNSIGGSTIGRNASAMVTDKAFVEKQIKLQVKTLDSFNLNEVDFIKIDIQGYEYEMLKGSVETLKRNKPVVLVELVSDNVEHVEVVKFLDDLGFRLKLRMGKDGIFVPKKRLGFIK